MTLFMDHVDIFFYCVATKLDLSQSALARHLNWLDICLKTLMNINLLDNNSDRTKWP